MPQLDHYNFTFAFFSFSVCFLFTIILIATVYLPMLHRHLKVKELHYKELIAHNIILEKEALLLLENKEQYILAELQKRRNFDPLVTFEIFKAWEPSYLKLEIIYTRNYYFYLLSFSLVFLGLLYINCKYNFTLFILKYNNKIVV